MNARPSLLALLAATVAVPALAEEVNVYSLRQPELVQPLFDRFTEETGIAVNVACVEKGMVLKRFTARAKGRGNRIVKPTCHVFLTVGN